MTTTTSIEVWRGRSATITFGPLTVSGASTPVTGLAADAITFAIKASLDDADSAALFHCHQDTMSITTDAVNGDSVAITLTPTQTLLLTPDVCVCALGVTDLTGRSIDIDPGVITLVVRQPVWRAAP